MLKRFISLSFMCAVSVAVFAQDDDDDDKVKAQEIVYEKPTEWRVFSAGAPVAAFTVNKDILWYATADAVFSSSTKQKDIQKFPTLGKIAGSGIIKIAADASGKTWMAGPNGIAVKNGTQFTNYTNENGLPDNDVRDLIVAPDGKIWIATAKGAAVFDGSSWKVYTTKEGLSSDNTTVVAADSKGGIWIGSMKGISVFNGSSWTIWDMKKGMSWNNVKALAWDKRTNSMWAAVGEKDINCFEKGSWKVYMDIATDITSIMVDTQSRIWIGHAGGVIKFNGDEWISDSKKHGIPAASIQDMYRDGSGNLWYATENGVLRLANPYPY
ncbi:MAG TPA: two-component regulator propeller domain-containing protein [Chitinispirillaceae bacterium]|nr:two-component regulator propeller domain-containing protein [Chitinispirillaceae bacterium]